MIKDMIFGIVGGLGLFLFGMGLMSDGLKKVAGQKLKNIIESMTKKAFVGFLVGAGVTAIIQSSSATTVMIIGFINAGLLTLKQAIPVIIGTNVGTTATAWLVSISGIGALKISSYALPMVGFGFLLNVLGKSRQLKSTGQILLGLGILFIGLSFMKDAFTPLEESPKVQEIFIALGDRRLLAILAGAIVTMLIQSSSASIAIVQLLAVGGAFGTNWETALNVSVPFVLGCNIGTTITAQLAALQANRTAKRAALAHTIFNILGSLVAYPFIYFHMFGPFVMAIAPWKLDSNTIAPSIAIAHTIFNLGNSIVFLPLSNILAKIVNNILPVKQNESLVKPVVLEKHLLETPVIALEQAHYEIIRMARTAKDALINAIEGSKRDDRKKLALTRELEDYVDNFQLEITSYLSMLSQVQLSEDVSDKLPVLLHIVNDLERVGDHAVNIVEISERKIGQKLSFSDSAMNEALKLKEEVMQMFDNVIAAMENEDVEQAKEALKHENNINRMQLEFRRSHVARMGGGLCSAETGLIFIDLVDNIEKVGDHLTNIAQAIIGGIHWEGVKPKKVKIEP